MEEKKNKKVSMGERIYKTPTVQVIALSAAAAMVLCILTASIMLILGFGFVTDTMEDGTVINYFGIVRDGDPTFGWLCESSGRRGFVNGRGIKYSDGSRYEGELSGFYYSGEATFTDSNGDVYHGGYVWGKLNGRVTVEFADGGSFEGSYLDGKRQGYGSESFSDDNGNLRGYSGEYADGERNGYGVLIYADGSEYKGYFKDGMRHGEGFYRFASGDTYTGQFRNNVIHGIGTMFYSSGRVFSGEFRNGVPVLE